jgi:hypothetical protein
MYKYIDSPLVSAENSVVSCIVYSVTDTELCVIELLVWDNDFDSLGNQDLDSYWDQGFYHYRDEEARKS